MASGAQTFGLHDTFVEPQVLPPPPVRHALLIFLVGLAAILHLGTAGWSEIHNGAEGLYAASAREMLAANNSLVPRSGGALLPNEPPLTQWLLLGSYNAFGINAVAARLPIALAFVACVALTFLIGERLGGYWRGFVAGGVYLCSCGGFTIAQFVTPAPVLAAAVAGAILCAVAGYQRTKTRRLWFAGFWACAAAAYLTGGAFALLLLTVIVAGPALGFREARMRFRALFHWSGVAAFAAVVLPWLIFLQLQSPGAPLHSVWFNPFAQGAIAEQLSSPPLRHLAAAHLLWWFPTILLVVPGIILAWRKVIRPHEFAFADAVPLCWTLAGFLLLLVAGGQHGDSLPIWSGFALFAASAWERISPALQRAGILLVGVVGIAVAIVIARGRLVLPGLGHSAFQQGDNTLLTLIGLALAVCCAAAGYLVWHGRDTLAITTLLLAMVPIGLGGAESIARNSPYLSFAPLAQFFRSPEERPGDILFEGRREAASSLEFYLPRGFSIVNEPAQHASSRSPALTPAEALDRMAQPTPVYLIIHKDRVPWWQEQLTARFHIYHQVTSCGMHVVVNNHP